MRSFIGAVLFFFLVVLVPHASEKFIGQFIGDLIVKDTGGAREFELVEEFRYLDPKRTLWIVPKGTIVDGASIPRYLWSFIGSPWTGIYKRASVIHDYFFEQKKYDSDSVHRVFYHAMVTSGTSKWKALLMYYAVLRFNDRWEESIEANYPCLDESSFKYIRCYPVLADELEDKKTYVRKHVTFNEKELEEVKQTILSENMSLEDIEELARKNLKNSGID